MFALASPLLATSAIRPKGVETSAAVVMARQTLESRIRRHCLKSICCDRRANVSAITRQSVFKISRKPSLLRTFRARFGRSGDRRER